MKPPLLSNPLCVPCIELSEECSEDHSSCSERKLHLCCPGVAAEFLVLLAERQSVLESHNFEGEYVK